MHQKTGLLVAIKTFDFSSAEIIVNWTNRNRLLLVVFPKKCIHSNLVLYSFDWTLNFKQCYIKDGKIGKYDLKR
ncbi:hypothetical protein BpHYR1_037555 [Brachionus plicatilis]|uniref:Uncharacterized protein n=1 Tax=Brachionus plicatilis TaxID=10195 RepID=A0A3M7QJM1_BRAPC|nr:hypothetical protein BpHYR1_037555 [Brachionus plicatilis]